MGGSFLVIRCEGCVGESVLVVRCEGCVGMSVLVIGCDGCKGVSVLVIRCEGCAEVGSVLDLFSCLPVFMDALWLPLWCSKSSRCVRECPSLILELSPMMIVLSCDGSLGGCCRGRCGGGCGGGCGGSCRGLPLVRSSIAVLA